MYAEKRDQPSGSDENLGRWILGGVALLAIAAGVWYWQKRGTGEPEAPAEPTPAAAEPAIRNPIVAPDDIDPNRAVAKYRDGVLHISLARQETALPRRIDVQ